MEGRVRLQSRRRRVCGVVGLGCGEGCERVDCVGRGGGWVILP